MKCHQARKYVEAFSDGELDVARNLEVLEHLNMCPACTRRASDIPALRAALARMWSEQRAPKELRDRIALSLQAIDEGRTVTAGPAGGAPRPHRMLRRVGFYVPFAVAASLLLAVSLWRHWPSDQPKPGTATVVSARAASDIRQQHEQCVTRNPWDHHDESLSRQLPLIADRLSRRLGLAVLAPDLSAGGFELVGADRCGVRGRQGAHILYHSRATDTMLSVFTVVRMSELQPSGLNRFGGRDYYAATEGGLSVVAWHDGQQTHALCGSLPEMNLIELAGQVRVAGAFSTPDAAARLVSFTR